MNVMGFSKFPVYQRGWIVKLGHSGQFIWEVTSDVGFYIITKSIRSGITRTALKRWDYIEVQP